MPFNQEQFNMLLSDKRTVMSFTNNDAGEGERIIVMNAFIRPHSPLLNEKKTGIINPHRNMSYIPVEYVRVCPRCHGEWHAVQRKVKQGNNVYTTYTCSSVCGVSICGDTYKRFATRNMNIDIPSTTGDSVARVEESLTLDIGDISHWLEPLDVGDVV